MVLAFTVKETDTIAPNSCTHPLCAVCHTGERLINIAGGLNGGLFKLKFYNYLFLMIIIIINGGEGGI